jgi:hypothetical protein
MLIKLVKNIHVHFQALESVRIQYTEQVSYKSWKLILIAELAMTTMRIL